jgi:hypothetical protein
VTTVRLRTVDNRPQTKETRFCTHMVVGYISYISASYSSRSARDLPLGLARFAVGSGTRRHEARMEASAREEGCGWRRRATWGDGVEGQESLRKEESALF